jgi:small subunit ribosomal protein S16
MLRIRLRRVGKKHHPFYRVVVANQPVKRDGAFLETLGSYDPHADPPTVQINEEATRAWLGKGAQPSEAAEKILRRAGILAAPANAAVAVAEVEAPAKGKKRAAAAPKAAAAPAAVAVAEAPAAEAPIAEAPAAEAVAEAPVAEAAAEAE